MNPAVRRAFGAAAAVVTATYTERKARFANEATPPLLAEAIEQAVQRCDELDRDHNRAHRIPTREDGP